MNRFARVARYRALGSDLSLSLARSIYAITIELIDSQRTDGRLYRGKPPLPIDRDGGPAPAPACHSPSRIIRHIGSPPQTEEPNFGRTAGGTAGEKWISMQAQ